MLGQDLRYALRLLIGNPGFAVVALLTMALGIGANTAIFSVIDTVLLRPAPVKDIDALAVVWETDRNTSTTREPASLPDFLDYKQRSQRVEQIAAFARQRGELRPRAGRGDPAAGARGDRRVAADARRASARGARVHGRGGERGRSGGRRDQRRILDAGVRARHVGRRPHDPARRPAVHGDRDHGARVGLRHLPDPVGGRLLARVCRPRRARGGGRLAAVPAHAADRCRARRIRSSWWPGCGEASRQRRKSSRRSPRDLERAYPENAGARRLRRAAVGGRLRAGPPGAARAADRGGPRPARRVRERGQPAPGARHGAAPRSGGAHRAWCERVAVDAPVRGRRACCSPWPRRPWRGAGRARRSSARRARPGRHPAHRRRLGGSCAC